MKRQQWCLQDVHHHGAPTPEPHALTLMPPPPSTHRAGASRQAAPRHAAAGTSHDGARTGPRSTKRSKKQATLLQFNFSNTAKAETPRVLASGDTPATAGTARTARGTQVPAAVNAWNTTAQRQLEKFGLGTPLSVESDGPSSNATDTCVYGDGDGEDEFKISMSQSYTRILSQAELSRSPNDPRLSLQDSPDHYTLPGDAYGCAAPAVAPAAASDIEGQASNVPELLGDVPYEEPSSTQPPPEDQHPAAQPAPVELPTSSAAVAATRDRRTTATTPELVPFCGGAAGGAGLNSGATPEMGICQAGGHAVPAFEIFQPKEMRKLVLFIRHGESEFNRAMRTMKGFSDPLIFDPKLTPEGRQQAMALRGTLSSSMAKHGNPLWVVSPLTRALQTFLLACPVADRLRKLGSPSGSSAEAPPNVAITSLCTEFMQTAGDVGRPPSHLKQDFPQLAEHLSGLRERWWPEDPAKPCCAVESIMGALENKASLQHRVAEFERWLRARPEKFIVCIGHSSFLKTFTGNEHHLKNCEVLARHW